MLKHGQILEGLRFVREGTDAKQDLDGVKEVIKSLSAKEKKSLGPRFFYDDAQYRYVKTVDSEPVGFVEDRATGKKGHLNLAVKSDFRGKGIADELVKKAIADAKEKELNVVYSLTDVDNTACRGLLEKNKFKLVSEKDGVARYSLTIE